MSKAKQFVDSWMVHRAVTEELIEFVSDKDLDFKPWADAMSLKKLILHMITSADLFATAAKEGAIIDQSGAGSEIQTAEALKQFAREVSSKTTATFENLSDNQFDELIDLTSFFGTKLPGHVLLQMTRDHEIHHKGQLFTYLRMIGKENLPMFKK
ncbi:DinB family protein [Bacillus marasmi]|uniref:DinB family protein n=1 Tax=Bacillus marasmi TaxID=1926279 RepID=UPI0011C88F21|nr:DinB family protein [Bacillus marasmi]